MNINDLIPTFDALKPSLAEDFQTQITAILNRLLETHGENVDKLGRTYTPDGALYRAYGYRFLTWKGGIVKGLPTINTEWLAKQSEQYAEDQIKAFTYKLVKKLGNLTEVVIHNLSVKSFTFRITGELNGRKVSVEQTRIINVSVKGNLFHQWPARITVDGKATSEAAFKALN